MAEAKSASASTRALPAGNYVEWSAIFAGGVMAAALSFVFITFGATIGLSVASPWEGSSVLGAKGALSLAAFWAIAQQIGAVMAGAYIAGRMRTSWREGDEDERDFRDGVHGGLVWGVAVLATAYVALSAAGSATRSAADIAARAAGGATTLASAAAQSDPISYRIASLLRPGSAPAAQETQGAAAGAATDDTRQDLYGVFARAISSGTLTDQDRNLMAGLIAQRTGIPRGEAENRVRSIYAETVQAAKETADQARQTAIAAGLVTAISLVVSLAAGWWAAIQGGNHRDNAIPARLLERPLLRSFGKGNPSE